MVLTVMRCRHKEIYLGGHGREKARISRNRMATCDVRNGIVRPENARWRLQTDDEGSEGFIGCTSFNVHVGRDIKSSLSDETVDVFVNGETLKRQSVGRGSSILQCLYGRRLTFEKFELP